jgi:hypothetical protein
MLNIFYDLETTDRHFMGQIINYCFIAVGDDYQPVKELSGLMRISRLQLPSPYAIITNRVNVLEHQERANDDEFVGLARIHDFISSVIAGQPEKPHLIGFNSARFDLQYLRTSFVRNGLDPYFAGKLGYRDLLHVATKLSCTRADFPRQSKDKPDRISLSLETLTRSLNLLDAAQDHESRSDVLLTIRLAQHLREHFGTDVRTFEAYEPGPEQEAPRSGRVFMSKQPCRDIAAQEISLDVPLTLLDSNYRYALWVDLAKYAEGGGRKSIVFVNKAGGALFMAGGESADPHWRQVAEAALAEFKALNLNNYFGTSTCDIEQDIYRLDFDGMEALRIAMRAGDLRRLKQINRREATALFRRFEMLRHTWGTANDGRIEEMLRQYALYRYGGRAPLSKFTSPEPGPDGKPKGWFHQTYAEMLGEVAYLTRAGSNDDGQLMAALKAFYESSDIQRLAGEALLSVAPQPVGEPDAAENPETGI